MMVVTYTPHLVKGYLDNQTKKFIPFKFEKMMLGIDKKIFDIVKEGMFLVVNGSGTAAGIGMNDIEMAGKTGTAQNPHGKDHALFIGFAPFDNPKIAVAVVVENVGFGATWAAPIAKKMIEAYLLKDKTINRMNRKNMNRSFDKNIIGASHCELIINFRINLISECLFLILLLFGIGLAAIYSSTVNHPTATGKF